MPDALPLTGLFGKVPAHGDFVRRGLPTSFVGPWDAWLQDGMATAREQLGDRWAAQWDGAPPWRFALPAGACGPDAVAGVMLPSEDMVGRRFPITLAVLLPTGAAMPAPSWFAVLEAAALAGRAGYADADALAAAIPLPGTEPPEPEPEVPVMGWVHAEPADAPVGEVPALGSDGWAQAEASALPEPADAPDIDDTQRVTDVLGLLGADAGTRLSEPPPESGDDVLDFFSRPSAPPPDIEAAPPVAELPTMATPSAPDASSMDGTLSFLLGEARGGEAAAPQPDGDRDPLSVLIAAGGTDALPVPDDGALAALPEPLPAAVEPLPSDASIPADFAPLPSAAPILLPPAAAPPPPPDGGWWTGGGGRLPPSTRPQPALIPAAAFASLLEADA